MEPTDRSDSNLPGRRLGPARRSRPRSIIQGLAHQWWSFLLLWLMASAPLAYLIYTEVKPTYQASIPHAARSEASSSSWNLSVIKVLSRSAWVVERPSSTSSMAARNSANVGWYRP